MIKLKHVVIREAQVSDVPTLISWWATFKLMQHNRIQGGIQTSIDQLRTELEKQEMTPIDGPDRRFIILTQNDNTPIGEIWFHRMDSVNQSCEIGFKIWAIDEQLNSNNEQSSILHWWGNKAPILINDNQSLKEEALHGFIAHLFKTYHLHRIYVHVLLEDEVIQKLYEEVGFKTVGIERDVWFDTPNNFHSAVLMDLLRKEYLH